MKIVQAFVSMDSFQRILDGDKHEVRREIRPKNMHELIEYVDDDGHTYSTYKDVPPGLSVTARPLAYDAIEITCSKDTRTIMAECKAAQLEILEDSDGNILTYSYGDYIFALSNIVFTLGAIIKQ